MFVKTLKSVFERGTSCCAVQNGEQDVHKINGRAKVVPLCCGVLACAAEAEGRGSRGVLLLRKTRMLPNKHGNEK